MASDNYTFFRQAVLRLCSTLDLERGLHAFLEYARHHLPLDQITVNLYEKDLASVRVIAGADQEGGHVMDVVSPISPGSRSFLDQDPVPVRKINDPASDLLTSEMTKRMGRQDASFLILALKLEGQRLGAVVMRADGVGRYTEAHVRLVEPLIEPFAISLSNFLKHREVVHLKAILAEENRFLRGEPGDPAKAEIVGADFGLRPVLEMATRVAATNSPVLILGETGVGKELIANAIHYVSDRSEGPFIKVNCGAIPENLVESELFGHEKGAFTGAATARKGRFELAHKGTIFLDEVGELRPEVQIRLLRVLQSGDIERVGGQKLVKVDIRVLVATHRNLEEMVARGDFREDLYYRINVFPITVPPLRERKEDIPALVSHFINKRAPEMGLKTTPCLAPGEMDRLLAYDWPGNVRELFNLLERAMILCGDGPLIFEQLSKERDSGKILPPSADTESFSTLDQAMSEHILAALEISQGRIEGEGGAAERLGLNPSTLRNRMKKLRVSKKGK